MTTNHELLERRAKLSVSYSHNFATAKPDIGATEKEHILGLCVLVKDLAAALSQTAGEDASHERARLLVPVLKKSAEYWGNHHCASELKRAIEIIEDLLHAAAPAASGGDNCEDCQIHRQAHHSLDNIVMGAGVFEVLHEGGVEPAWKNTIEAVKKLANPQPSASVSELARALLAAQYRASGFNAAADWIAEADMDAEENDLDRCVIRAIEQALTQQPTASAEHWHGLYRKECRLRQDDAARYGQQIVDLEAALTQQRGEASVRIEDLGIHTPMRHSERADAEQAYSITAHDFEKNPIGSRDWTIYWRGWWHRSHLYTTPQPSADAVRELVKRWRGYGKDCGVSQVWGKCADELESLISAASGEKGVG